MPAAWLQRKAAPEAIALQGMVNVAHHEEVAILDERRAHDTIRIPGYAQVARISRQTARDI